MSNTLPPLFRSHPAVVVALLTQAQHIDPRLDNPYMPFERTTLKEAVKFLRKNGSILLQSGKLYYGTASLGRAGFFATMWGRDDVMPITWQDALLLLKNNYTDPQRPYPKAAWVAVLNTFPYNLLDEDRPTLPVLYGEVEEEDIITQTFVL